MSASRIVPTNNILVALKNGAIRIYNEKRLVNEIKSEDNNAGIVYGVFGREEGCLVINHQSGGM